MGNVSPKQNHFTQLIVLQARIHHNSGEEKEERHFFLALLTNTAYREICLDVAEQQTVQKQFCSEQPAHSTWLHAEEQHQGLALDL